jgi:peroxiredoxin
MMDTVTNQKSLGFFSLLSGRRLSQGLLLLLIIGLCITNGLLIKQNRDLKAAIAPIGKQPEFLKPGQPVPPLAANTLSGQRQMVNYAVSAKTVLLVFAPQCTACERALPYWREIKEVCARNQYQIFGISLDDSPKTNAFLKMKGLNVESFVDIDAEAREAYKLSLTPMTIVIDNNGKVERIWPGAFNPETKLEVERYFGISVRDDVK